MYAAHVFGVEFSFTKINDSVSEIPDSMLGEVLEKFVRDKVSSLAEWFTEA